MKMCSHIVAFCSLLLPFCPLHPVHAAEPQTPPAEKPAPGEVAGARERLPMPAVVQPAVVVTASRLETQADQTGVSITTIDGDEDRTVFQNKEFSETLRNTPGLNVSRSGLTGDFTSVFTRGGNSNHTLFLYDGWKVNRQGGNFDLGRVDAVQAQRIEIARGPSSSLFGTDAVTGAINVITEKGSGRPDLTVSAAGGTFGTDRETLSLSGSEGKFAYSVGSSRLNRLQATWKNSDLEMYNYAARFDYDINPEHHLKLIARGSDFHKGFYENSGSGFGAAVEPNDPNDSIETRDVLVGFEYKGRIAPIWETTVRVGHYYYDSEIISKVPNPVSNAYGFSQSTGRTDPEEYRPTVDWQNDITAYENEDKSIRYVVTAGAGVEFERFDQKDSQFGNNFNLDQTNWSIFLQNRLELYDRAFITVGGRREEHDQFGEFLTGRADVAILVPESDTRIHGSVGNAFRAPSFFEFFSQFGNPDLQPEENFAYDVGLEQHFWKKRIKLGATWFHNSFDQLLNFDFDTNRFANLNEAESRGFEFEAEFNPIRQLTLRGTATLQHTEDDQQHRLLRRPGNQYTAQLIARPVKGLSVSFDLLRTGSRGDFGVPGRVHGDPFTRVDLAVSYRFLSHWRAFARVENLFNEHYEEVETFPGAGSNILAGIEFNWQF
jgi:vitamin B12 transporter